MSFAGGIQDLRLAVRALLATPIVSVVAALSLVTLLIGIGVTAGAGMSRWLSTIVASLLYGLEPRDPLTLVAATTTLAAVACVAGGLPAWRASRIDPAAVLREA